jgi:hypothetical protein
MIKRLLSYFDQLDLYRARADQYERRCLDLELQLQAAIRTGKSWEEMYEDMREQRDAERRLQRHK